ncbi:FkbM family methyltransferase [Candidatus Margulisiibacteriota bacterium]
MDIFRRAKTSAWWFKGEKHGVSLIDLVQQLFAVPCMMKGKRKIKKIDINGEYAKITFKNIGKPFYFPRTIPLYSLFRVIAECFYKDDWHYYEIPETMVKKNDVVVDCGAAEGLFTFLVAPKCSKVFAIEPLSQFINSIKLSTKHFDNVAVIRCALSDKEGKGKISLNDICSSLTDETEAAEPVNITTIDELFYKKNIPINYLKADIEGYELAMLNGAVNTIRNNKPKIAITTYHKPEHAEQIAKFLRDLQVNYQIKCKGIEAYTGAPVMLHAWVVN